MLRFIGLLGERNDVVKQALPVLLAPRIVTLKERHKKLVAGVQNLADRFYVSLYF